MIRYLDKYIVHSSPNNRPISLYFYNLILYYIFYTSYFFYLVYKFDLLYFYFISLFISYRFHCKLQLLINYLIKLFFYFIKKIKSWNPMQLNILLKRKEISVSILCL